MEWLIWLIMWLFYSFSYSNGFNDVDNNLTVSDNGYVYSDEKGPTDITLLIYEEDKPSAVSIKLLSDDGGYMMENMYEIDYMVTGTVGMVSVPVEITKYDGTYSGDDNTKLIFEYDDSKLTCEESDLVIMKYLGPNEGYDILYNFELDEEANTISLDISADGIYLVEDIEIWTGVWTGTYTPPDTMQERECHWHDVFPYEDIEELADTSIYDGSGEYHIYTVNQLAGLVKLVNEGNDFTGASFYLEEDLDLAGYEWVPIGWNYPANDGYYSMDFPFNGKFYGNGHVIYNMSIVNPEWCDLGLFGRALSEFEVHDLGVANCYVEGRLYNGGIVGDNINPGEDFDMTNCFVTGTIIGEDQVGALVGSSAYLKLKDCYAYVTVMEDEDGELLVGDLRGGEIVDCHINDETAEEKLAEYME